MSVTYLMQYSVQYIIAPVIWAPAPSLDCLDGMKKNGRVWLVWAWKLKKKKKKDAKVEFIYEVSLWLQTGLITLGDWAAASVQLSLPLALTLVFSSDMHPACRDWTAYVLPSFNLLERVGWEVSIVYLQ